MTYYYYFFVLILHFIHPLDYFPEMSHGGFWYDVVITTPVLDSLDNVLQLLCNTMLVKG